MGEPALDTDEISWVMTPPIQGGKTPPAATILQDIFTVRLSRPHLAVLLPLLSDGRSTREGWCCVGLSLSPLPVAAALLLPKGYSCIQRYQSLAP